MREELELVWFFNENCEYCVELEPQVQAFALKKGARLTRVRHGILDPETNEPVVPALIFSDDRVKNRIFYGRWCLDALRHTLENG